MPRQSKATQPLGQAASPDTIHARERMHMSQVVQWTLKHDFDAAPFAAVQERALVYLPGMLAASGVGVAGGTPPRWIEGIANYRFVSEIELTPSGLPLWHVVAERGDELIRDPWVPAEDLLQMWRVLQPDGATLELAGGTPTATMGVGQRLGRELLKAVELLKESYPPNGIPPTDLSDYAVIQSLETRGVSRSTGQRALDTVRK
jgi:hypothetical protein